MEPQTTPPPWLTEIGKLRAGQFPSEDALQKKIAQILTAHRVQYRREEILTEADRIDFYVNHEGDAWGIECKISGAQAVWAQLYRYAPHFHTLVLVTTKPVAQKLDVLKDGHPMPFHLLELWRNF